MAASANFIHAYRPRSYFKAFHARRQQFACLVVHRRGGKTHAVINDMVVRALRTKKKDWRGGYVSPTLSMAKDAAWSALQEAVRDMPGVVVRVSELAVIFPNGARIRLYGIDNPASLRGGWLDYACLDEYQDMNPTVLGQVVMPMLSTRHGWLVVIGTPKGKNQLFDRYTKACANPKWFTHFANIDDTGEEALTAEQKATQREEMDDAEWNQEFMCSFTAEFRGSYYSRQLDELDARKEPRAFGVVPHDPTEAVQVAMDVGQRDACTIWFWQYVDGEVRIIDYYEETGKDAEEVCEELRRLPYRYEAVWLPHDAFHRTFQTKKSAFDTFVERGLPARRVPNPDKGNRVYHGIDIVRKVLRTYPLRFDAKRCAPGIEALRNYSRKYDLKTKVYANEPSHDRWSHGADAFRYLATVLDPTAIQRSLDQAYRAGRLAVPQGPIDGAGVNTIRVKPMTMDDMIRLNQLSRERRARFENKGRN